MYVKEVIPPSLILSAFNTTLLLVSICPLALKQDGNLLCR